MNHAPYRSFNDAVAAWWILFDAHPLVKGTSIDEWFAAPVVAAPADWDDGAYARTKQMVISLLLISTYSNLIFRVTRSKADHNYSDSAQKSCTFIHSA